MLYGLLESVYSNTGKTVSQEDVEQHEARLHDAIDEKATEIFTRQTNITQLVLCLLSDYMFESIIMDTE